MQNSREIPAWRMSGFAAMALLFGLGVVGVVGLAEGTEAARAPSVIGGSLALVLLVIGVRGFFTLEPNKAAVLVFFGRYVGTVTRQGFHWANPLARRVLVSLRVRNFNIDKIKVNDAMGNPIQIGAVIVWRIVDTAKAQFDVQSVREFVALQSETAIRAMASRFPYDEYEDPGAETLRGNPDHVAEVLKRDVQDRLGVAGVEVMEARISHLAYAQEIAQAMLRRQQAEAIVAARRRIVDGAVGMVEMALERLEKENVVELDNERRAAMVNNLLVAVVSERDASPVINTGSLY
ncbi:MAG: SPFH domain-containing protein [Myxococcales bacterium]|nr:SPFH domain-containing protein [Myxococcales bacterium]MCB9713212.1 SPFH domain-containing protein [Myxococcales bacterium]